MPNFRLSVNGRDLDFQNQGALSLNVMRKAEDLVNPIDKRADFSLRFQLPLTRRNRQVLGTPDDAQQLRYWLQAQPLNATVFSDEAVVLDGLMTVLEADAAAGTATCFIVGKQLEWADVLGKRKLNEIPLRTIPYRGLWDLTLPEATALGITQEHPDFLTPRHNQLYDVAFPLVSYSPYFIPNKWTRGFDIVGNKAYAPGLYGPLNQQVFGSDFYYIPQYGLDGQGMLNFGDVPPSAYLSNVVRAMFRAAGYEVASSWLDDPETLKLVIPYVGTGYQWNWGRLGRATINEPGPVSPRIDVNPFPVPAASDCYLDYVLSSIPGNPSIYRKALPLPAVEINYGNRASINTRFTNYSSTLTDSEVTVYRAPVTGWYTFDLSLDITALAYNESLGYAFPVADGGRTYFGITRAPSIGDVITENTYSDGQIVENDAVVLGSNNVENVIAYVKLSGLAYPASLAIPAIAPGPGGELVDLGSGPRILAFLEAGDAVFPWVVFLGSSPIIITPGDTWNYQSDLENVFIDIEHIGTGGHPVDDPQTFVPADLDLQPGKNLPDVGCTEFLRDLIKMFNLYVETDYERRIVYMEPRPRYYFPNFDAFRLDGRASLRRARYSPPDVPQAFAFRYLFDSDDIFAPPRSAVNGIDIGFYDFAFNTGATSDIERVTQDLEVIAPMEFRTFRVTEPTSVVISTTPDFNNSFFRPLLNITLPVLWNQDAREASQNAGEPVNYAYAVRIMKMKALEPAVVGMAPQRGLTYRFWDITQPAANFGRDQFTGWGTGASTYVRCVFVDADTPPSPTPAVWSLDWGGTFGLYRLNWDAAIEELLAGTIVNIEAGINGQAFAELILRRPVLLEGMYFRLLEAGPFEAGKLSPTKLKLLRYGG